MARNFGQGFGQGILNVARAISPTEERRQAGLEGVDAKRKTLMATFLGKSLQEMEPNDPRRPEIANALDNLGFSELAGVGGGAPKVENTRLTKLQNVRATLEQQPQSAVRDKRITEISSMITKLHTIVGRTAEDVLSTKDIENLSAVGGKVERFADLVQGFKSEFGGWGLNIVGDFVNFAKRKFGDKSGQALWWQDYKSLQNTVRHKLFGSALTATEKKEWELTIINPGDHPDIIKGNLARQQDIAKRAANKIANSMLAKGKTMNDVRTALGGAAQYLDIGGAQQTVTPTVPADPSNLSDEQLLGL